MLQRRMLGPDTPPMRAQPFKQQLLQIQVTGKAGLAGGPGVKRCSIRKTDATNLDASQRVRNSAHVARRHSTCRTDFEARGCRHFFNLISALDAQGEGIDGGVVTI